MNKLWSLIVCILWKTTIASGLHAQKITAHPNLIIITTDGLRWQELFLGLDESLCHSVPEEKEHYVQYGLNDLEGSRSKIFPFIWNTLSKHAALYGNRDLKNKVDTKNFHRFSYPGYSEMFCGTFDAALNTNKKVYNRNVSVLEDLNNFYAYAGQVAAFTSWDVFPYILSEARSGVMVNAGWEAVEQGTITPALSKLNAANKLIPAWKKETRYDDLTWQMSMEYAKTNHPKVLFVSLDETDHYAHKGDYKNYIEAAHQFDQYVQEMWEFIQCDDFYKDNTYLLLTTDHGRGSTASTWQSHGFLPLRSGETWYIEYGPGLESKGEIRKSMQNWQSSIAHHIADYCNISFVAHTSEKNQQMDPGESIASKQDQVIGKKP